MKLGNPYIDARHRAKTVLVVLAAGAFLSGCARLQISVTQEPYQEESKTGIRRQAVKETRYFWGLWKRVATPCVDYDYYRRLSYWQGLFTTEMRMNKFYTHQPGMPGYLEGSELMPLEGSFSSWAVLLGRSLTLGMFWDSGYTADNENWGLWNEVYNKAWFGKAEFIIAMDPNGNFYTRRMTFDPSKTVALTGKLIEQGAQLYYKFSAAPALAAVKEPDPNNPNYQDQLARKRILEAEQARLANLQARADQGPIDTKKIQDGLERLDEQTRVILKTLAISYENINGQLRKEKEEIAIESLATVNSKTQQAFRPAQFP